MLFDADGHVMLTAVGATLRDADRMLLLPMEPCTLRLRSHHRLSAVAGDMEDGRWIVREELDVRHQDGWVSIALDSTSARSLILLGRPGRRAEQVAWLTALMKG